MTASQPNLLELAKQGDATAIASLMNRHLQPKGVTATATLEDGCLQVALESQQVPNQPSLVEFIQKGVTNLGVDAIKQIRIYGVQTGKVTPVWEQDIFLQPYAAVPDLPPIETPLPAADEIVPSMPDVDADLYNESDAVVEKKPGFGSFVSQNWKVIPMMVIAALVGFAAVVFILSRSTRSPQPVAESPTPAAASPTPATDPATSPAVPASPAASPTTSPTPVAATPTSPASPVSPATPASPAATASPAPVATTSPAPTATSPTASAPPFQQALQVGYSAAVNTQNATTRSQWNTVVSEWQQAIALLGSVPATDGNYAAAQQKITEYQRNLSYAQRRLQQATTP
ncbi:hypothetical protein H6G89_08315 [Oscillatoria sp. FACHB-1407]|uniref:hypothetical protein n=1 Tax=Oscillatoria sp. FACHB-1407 TaxID=2692847 RepID=UPI00168430FD|nr:hypothetical protein [Oscillatoria sp. FACHB-1407]MBD2461044.1 hypothetical protein [Oscillatoria sp. FACHB-1407]